MLKLDADGLDDEQIGDVQDYIDRLRSCKDPSLETQQSPADADEVLAIMQRLRESGVAKLFGDPVEWQREMRNGSKLAECRET